MHPISCCTGLDFGVAVLALSTCKRYLDQLMTTMGAISYSVKILAVRSYFGVFPLRRIEIWSRTRALCCTLHQRRDPVDTTRFDDQSSLDLGC